MNKYQFYLKQGVAVHLDTSSKTFDDEQAQLLEQDFELSERPIEAENVEVAYQKYQSEHGKEGVEYPLVVASVLDIPQIIASRTIFGG